MEDREILANAIDKAIANGYEYPYIDRATELIIGELATVYYIIFHHSFAKAFWGEDYYVYWDEGYPSDTYTLDHIKEQDSEHLISLIPKGNYHWYQPVWAYHLQQIVLEENPIKYLEKFL